jgi:hypothetical protein
MLAMLKKGSRSTHRRVYCRAIGSRHDMAVLFGAREIVWLDTLAANMTRMAVASAMMAWAGLPAGAPGACLQDAPCSSCLCSSCTVSEMAHAHSPGDAPEASISATCNSGQAGRWQGAADWTPAKRMGNSRRREGGLCGGLPLSCHHCAMTAAPPR